jgi:hypothetical protein
MAFVKTQIFGTLQPDHDKRRQQQQHKQYAMSAENDCEKSETFPISFSVPSTDIKDHIVSMKCIVTTLDEFNKTGSTVILAVLEIRTFYKKQIKIPKKYSPVLSALLKGNDIRIQEFRLSSPRSTVDIHCATYDYISSRVRSRKIFGILPLGSRIEKSIFPILKANFRWIPDLSSADNATKPGYLVSSQTSRVETKSLPLRNLIVYQSYHGVIGLQFIFGQYTTPYSLLKPYLSDRSEPCKKLIPFLKTKKADSPATNLAATKTDNVSNRMYDEEPNNANEKDDGNEQKMQQGQQGEEKVSKECIALLFRAKREIANIIS